MITNSVATPLNGRLTKLVISATWLLFAITLGMDRAVADVVLLRGMDFIAVIWILAAAGGLLGAALGLRGWTHWWTLSVAAAILVVLADILYLYDVFGSGQDKSLGLAIHDIWKTLWHSLRSGAVAVAYRELIMPVIQLAILGYFTWALWSMRPKRH